ncbi:hypothetical protein OnM2_018036 [Erysiphe neolycopersici]|uniref:HTH CENPB-type domain-containing protein n=1 Tax=Erysiphe neolycopersici TaxID=212602 RepID=A0A420I4A0_9PEZI|nr:hypothetical protein OnM2_018036 [Erysiphe neolycopersici]
MLDLQPSNLNENGEYGAWDPPSQSSDPDHQSSMVTHDPLELHDIQRLTDEYFGKMITSKSVTQESANFDPPSTESLPFAWSSVIAWSSLHSNTIEPSTPPLDIPTPSMPPQSNTKSPTALESSYRRSSNSHMKKEDSKKAITSKRRTSTRKTLTNEQRRKICEYKREAPSLRQVDIANQFSIERSTVSKVLKNKEKHLASGNAVCYQAKQKKGKFQKLERTISNWILNEVNKGQNVTINEIKRQARKFAELTNDPESLVKCEDKSWLAKFDQQNFFETTRRHSEPNFRAEIMPLHFVKSDQAANCNNMTHQNNSDWDSNALTGSESTISSTPYSILLDGSSITTPPQSASSWGKRRQTLPALETSLTNYWELNYQNISDDIASKSKSPFQIDYRENINNQSLSHPNDQLISFIDPMNRDYSDIISPTISPIKLENTDHQSLPVNLVPSALKAEDKALIAFEFLINYFSEKNKISISPVEYNNFYKLSEKMGLAQSSLKELPQSF